MKLAKYFFRYSLFTIFNFVFFVAETFSQPKLVVPERAKYEAAEDNTWWYVMIFLLVAGLGGAIYWYLKDKNSKKAESDLAAKKKKQISANDNSVDFDSELEWYRKHKNVVNKKSPRKPGKKISHIPNPTEVNAHKQSIRLVRKLSIKGRKIHNFHNYRFPALKGWKWRDRLCSFRSRTMMLY